MDFQTSVKTCLTQNYVTFSGRASRPEYWWFALFVFLGTLVFGVLDALVFGTSGGPGQHAGETRIFAPLFQLATFLPFLAVGWRRMHDSGRPGWWLLLPVLVSLGLGLIFTGGMLGIMSRGTMPMPGFGLGGFAVIWLIQVALFILVVWWLTRPGQSGPNDYGPQPTR
ncbi:MAG: putative membrane protein [Rhodobacteraceae bacterium HLUCCO07]|nr:MAG: putative membrane protein [Rhodobacteraceae bacterium HLUCCO07]